jgi:hypothetical protein
MKGLEDDPVRLERRIRLLVRVAVILTGIAVLAATFLLIKETAYNFALFMFIGPPLIAAAGLCLGWAIFQELRHKQVL